MKSFYLLGLLCCISFSVRAQNAVNPCNFEYSVELIGCDENVSNSEKFATFKWDFTNPVLNDATMKIEVVPILDCWEELNAKQLRETISIAVEQSGRKGNAQVKMMPIQAKCFKWRTVITKQQCTSESDWKYHAFIPKRS